MAAKTVPRGLLGVSWAVLGGLGLPLEALEPSLDGLGVLLGRLEGVLGCSWGLLVPLGKVLAAR